MRNRTLLSIATAGALALSIVTPAHAGKADRAREAIAAAQAKIDAAETAGAGTEVPHQLAEAKAALARARENLDAGHKPESIDAAIQAQALADASLGESQKRKQAMSEAQQQAAQGQAMAAQQQAADATARAAAAEQSAAASAQQAADARAAAATAALQAQAAPVPAQAPATVETTVTTQTARPARTARTTTKHVVRKRTATASSAPAPAAVTATTTVSTTR